MYRGHQAARDSQVAKTALIHTKCPFFILPKPEINPTDYGVLIGFNTLFSSIKHHLMSPRKNDRKYFVDHFLYFVLVYINYIMGSAQIFLNCKKNLGRLNFYLKKRLCK